MAQRMSVLLDRSLINVEPQLGTGKRSKGTTGTGTKLEAEIQQQNFTQWGHG